MKEGEWVMKEGEWVINGTKKAEAGATLGERVVIAKLCHREAAPACRLSQERAYLSTGRLLNISK